MIYIVNTDVAVSRFYFHEDMPHFCHRNPWLMTVSRRKNYHDQNLNSAFQHIETNIRKLNTILLHVDSNLESSERYAVHISIGKKTVLCGAFTVFLSLHMNSKICFAIDYDHLHSSCFNPLISFDAE
jgi:hypothetical protein